MAELAIKWHETRGKEVIEIFEMLGAKNCDLKGCGYNLVYYIRTDGYIGTSYTDLSKDYKVFTLEEFLEKYPFKVGDKVLFKHENTIYFIRKMYWEKDNILYELSDEVYSDGCSVPDILIFDVDAENLQPYKEETTEETDTMNHTSEINLNHPVFKGCNEIELIIPNGWEFERRGDKMFGVRKQYPKTYEECCKIMGVSPNYEICIREQNTDGKVSNIKYSQNMLKILDAFKKLLICRDAYWKIAGEQMGLDKPWEPDWSDESENKYTIVLHGNKNCYANCKGTCSFLTFPNAEMRDTFFENFKVLIEECKMFL